MPAFSIHTTGEYKCADANTSTKDDPHENSATASNTPSGSTSHPHQCGVASGSNAVLQTTARVAR